jgi:hypothetical protein
MADPGEAFNMGDLIDPSLPMRRLEFGGHSEYGAFVYFAQGGFVPSHGLIVFQFHGGQAIVVFSARFIRGDARNVEQIREFIDLCEVIQ